MNLIISNLGILLVLAFLFVKTFNHFVKTNNAVKDAWSNIAVALKYHYNLTPILVETLKGYAQHEKTTLECVIHTRN